jgi:UDP-N-acetylmuramyl pentapeptide synthase
MGARRVHASDDTDTALQTLRRVVRKGDTVLLKASRAMQFEKIYEKF